MAKKSPNPIDQYVGSRVHMRRKHLDISQEALGDALGLTFQQIQKYEKGTNRMGASRLLQIAHVLQVPVSFFFEGAPLIEMKNGSQTIVSEPDTSQVFLASPAGIRMTAAMQRITHPMHRDIAASLVEALAAKVGTQEKPASQVIQLDTQRKRARAR